MAEKKELKTLNITKGSSGDGLRAVLDRQAHSRGMKLTRFVGQILEYAADHQGEFKKGVDNPRSKPGEHIGAEVRTDALKKLSDWAQLKQTQRGLLCCYILERVDEDDMYDKIFGV